MPAAPLVHPIHPVVGAIVPIGTNQWPGQTTETEDTTCFGCRAYAVAPVIGRRRREAEADPEAEAEAEAEAKPTAEIKPFVHLPHPGFIGHPFLPFHPTALVGSSSYAKVDHNGDAYTTGVKALHPVILGRKKRQTEETEAETEVEEATEVEAEEEGAPEAEVKAVKPLIPRAVNPHFAINGYAHSLPGKSYASVSTPNVYHPLPLPVIHSAFPFLG